MIERVHYNRYSQHHDINKLNEYEKLSRVMYSTLIYSIRDHIHYRTDEAETSQVVAI